MPIDRKLPADIFVPTASALPRAASMRAGEGSAKKKGLFRPGTIVGKYRIEELLGTGGFGAVYRATHIALRMDVAIKHVRPDVIARAPRAAEALLDEARCAARVRHPNVMRVFDVVEAHDLTYVVMEYVEGETLARTIECRSRLDAPEVVRIGIDVAEGLDAGLEKGIIHRDVKPSNVILSASGRACIIDLGLALTRVDASSRLASGGAHRFVGTRGYAAPEQLDDPANADFRADIYALGITLLEALCGATRSTGDGPPSNQRLLDLLSAMTRRDREARPRSYRDLIAALRAAAA